MTSVPPPPAAPAALRDSRRGPSPSRSPVGGVALISSATHPDKCLDVRGGLAQNGNGLQLWDCSDHPDMRFLTPAPGASGRIRWAGHPEFCLDARETGGVFLWECQDPDDDPNPNPNPHMQFLYEPRSHDSTGPV